MTIEDDNEGYEEEPQLPQLTDDEQASAILDNIKLTKNTLDRIPYHKGPYDAKIIFVGEAPGADEVLHPSKWPFVGYSGKELDTMLRKAGIDPQKCYFTNVVKERPPDNKFAVWVHENPASYKTYLKLLAAELNFLQDANVIVPLGAEALHAVCNKKSIENWRGSIIPATLLGSVGRKCVPTIHPAAVLREWLYRPACIEDFKRVLTESLTRSIDLPKRTYHIRPSFEFVVEFLTRLRRGTKKIASDIETLYNRMVSIQFADSIDEAICIPFQYRDGTSYFPLEQEAIIMRMVADLFENGGKRFIGQNFITYDTFVLAAYGIKYEKLLQNIWMDTLEAFKCLQPQLPARLSYITSIYTREPFYKSEGKVWNTKEGEDEFWTYGCKDVVVDLEAAPQIEQDLHDAGQWQQYIDRYEKLFLARMQMSMRGMKKDPIMTNKLEKKVRNELIRKQAELTILANQTINTNSFPQMSKLLYETMKLPKQYKQGKLTTNEDALLTLSAKVKSDVFPLVLGIRHNRVVYSNNIKSKTDSDGRLRSSFGNTETGRFTSSQCPFNTGTNLQNWTSEMRAMLVPDSSELCFVEIDLSQADARVVYWRARDEDAIKIFLSKCTCPVGTKICCCGADFHVRNASLIFNLGMHEIDKAKRYTAKRTVHAADYNMKGPRFAQVYNKDATDNKMSFITTLEASLLLERFHVGRPNLRLVYHKELAEIINTTKTIVNPLGRKITYHGRIDEELYKQAYAAYAQSTVADVINTILERVCRIMCVKLQVHDSLLVQCKPDEVRDIVVELYKASNVPMDIEGRTLVIPMEVKAGAPGANWNTLEKYVLQEAA